MFIRSVKIQCAVNYVSVNSREAPASLLYVVEFLIFQKLQSGSYKQHGWKEFCPRLRPLLLLCDTILKRIFTSQGMITVIAFQTCQVVKGVAHEFTSAHIPRINCTPSFDRVDTTFMDFCMGHYSETTTQFRQDVNAPFYCH